MEINLEFDYKVVLSLWGLTCGTCEYNVQLLVYFENFVHEFEMIKGMMVDQNPKQEEGLYLTNVYLKFNQAAYAIDAFPIGTVLSIGPILLNEQKNVPLGVVGLLMAGGEALGIIAMKIAEMSRDGFILYRPHDLHLIIGLISLSLILMPFWSADLWYLTGVAMMLVQTLNSASKPVVGESLYRLAVLMKKEPSKVFAQANMFRRIGNACIGCVTPLVYSLSPEWSFYGVGGATLIFLVALISVTLKIYFRSQRYDTSEERLEEKEECSSTSSGEESTGEYSYGEIHKKNSTIGALSLLLSMKLNQNLDITGKQPPSDEEQDTTQHKEVFQLSPDTKTYKILYFLIVHAFSFWDAAISRLPLHF